MATDVATGKFAPNPLAHVGRWVLAYVAYLGGLILLAGSAARTLWKPPPGAPALVPAVIRQWEWMLGAGLPLVGFVHVGMGSFLAMQAYYGATFVEAAGPLVGVGLCRNVAPLMTGMTLAGLLGARMTWELSRRPLVELDGDPVWVPDRQVTLGREDDPRTPPEPGRLTAIRVVSATLAGPILALWATMVGTVVGWLISLQLLHVPTPIFFTKCLEMLWVRDVVGLLVKGAAFGLIASLFACFEGLRAPADPGRLPTTAARAVCFSAFAILVANMSWYVLVYMAGPAFGPTVLTPPAM